MKRTIGFILAVLVSALVLYQSAGAQEEGTSDVPAQSEELHGQIGIVEPEAGLLFIECNSVSYSLHVTPETKIVIENRDATIEDLKGRRGQSAFVQFRAERDGTNVAEKIHVP